MYNLASDGQHGISITGGTFSVDPSDYVASGYRVTESNSVYTVSRISTSGGGTTSGDEWHSAGTAWAIENGLINGMTDGTLKPQATATRAQVAAILARFCENVAQ